MKIDYTEIINAIIAIISFAITAVLIPLLKQKFNASQREKLNFWVKTAVKAAEQLHGAGQGKSKKEYVISFLNSKGIYFDVAEVDTLIESAVYEISNAVVELPVAECVSSAAEDG